MKDLLRRRFIRFLIVGALNTVFGYGVFAGLILLDVWYPIAAAVATVLGVLFNFKTTGSFVFHSQDHSLLLRFVAVYGIGYVIGVLALRVTNELGIPILAASAAMILPSAALSFALQRIFVFRGPR